MGLNVSVVLICYNKARELPCVISALAHGVVRPDLVVLSDDGSSDHSPQVFKECCDKYGLNHVCMFHPRSSKPFRLNTLRNDGIAVCPDGIIILLDADIVVSSTCLVSHMKMHDANNGEMVLSTGPRLEFAFPDCTGPVNFMWGHEFLVQNNFSGIDKIPAFPSWHSVAGANIGIKKHCIELVGPYDIQYNGSYGYDDLDFTYRAYQLGVKFVGSFEAYVTHIPHPPSMGTRNTQKNARLFREKHGFELEYPSIMDKLCRKPWSEFFAESILNL